MQIKDYTKVNELSDNDIFLIDGNDGTRTINSVNAANALAKKVNAENARNALDYGSLNLTTENVDDAGYDYRVMVYRQYDKKFVQMKLYNAMLTGVNVNSGMSARKSLLRGKNLGSVVTDRQWEAIRSGRFDDIFIGDFWVIGNITWRIVDIDYWYNTGDFISSNTHHLVIMPDTQLKTGVKMNQIDTTEGGYVGSDFYKNTFSDVAAIIKTAFPEEHLYNHREILCNQVSESNQESGWIWVSSTINLPNSEMLYGISTSRGVSNHYISSPNQLLYSILNPYFISIRRTYWLRDIYDLHQFAVISGTGIIDNHPASTPNDIRPVFGIY